MSRAATDWAWSLELKASQKILALSLADRADEYHCCYPSILRLVKDTGLDKKTIGKWINQMIEDGLISDTGERKGPTKRVRVLRLNIENQYTQKRDDSKNGNIPKNGTLNVPKNGCLNDPKFGSQNQSLEPTIETNNSPIVPKGESKGFNPLEVAIPEWLNEQAWREWVQYRSQSKKPIKTALTVSKAFNLLKECFDEGHDPAEVINTSIANGYQGLFKPKFQNRKQQQANPQTPHWNSREGWEDFI